MTGNPVAGQPAALPNNPNDLNQLGDLNAALRGVGPDTGEALAGEAEETSEEGRSGADGPAEASGDDRGADDHGQTLFGLDGADGAATGFAAKPTHTLGNTLGGRSLEGAQRFETVGVAPQVNTRSGRANSGREPDENASNSAGIGVTSQTGSAALTEGVQSRVEEVIEVDLAPVLSDDAFVLSEDRALVLFPSALLGNDQDPENGNLSIVAVSGAQHGQVSLQNGRIVYRPDADYHGSDQFEYQVSDGVHTVSARASLTVEAVNDVPVLQDATPLALQGTEDTPLTLDPARFLASAQDVDGDELRISSVQNAEHGRVFLDEGGQIRFTPDADFNSVAGSLARFEYTLSDDQGALVSAIAEITVAEVNDAPRVAQVNGHTQEDGVWRIALADLIDQGTDVDGDALSLVGVDQARNGAVRLQDGFIEFRPDTDFHSRIEGNDGAQFRFTLADGRGGLVVQSAHIHVASVNDAPEVNADASLTLDGTEDRVLVIEAARLLATASDVDGATDGDTLRIASVQNAVNGRVELDEQGRIQFTPDANIHSAEGALIQFDYTVTDIQGAQVTTTAQLNLAEVNDAPTIAPLAGQTLEDGLWRFAIADLIQQGQDVDGDALTLVGVSQARHGTVTLVGDNIEFRPHEDFHSGRLEDGAVPLQGAGFQFTLSDGRGGLITQAAHISVASVNDAPEVTDTHALGEEDRMLVLTADQLLAGARDVDGDALRLVNVENAVNGQVSLADDGTVHFTPDADFHGAARFDYHVADTAGGLTLATAFLGLNPINDRPVLVDQAFSQDEDRTLLLDAGQLLAGATDVDGDRLSVSAVGDAEHGTVSLSDTGQIRFTPDANYHGPARFSYTVNDGSGADNATRTAWANLTIRSVNDAPVLETQAVFSEDEDTALLIDPASLIATASDMDGDTLTLIGVDQPSHGTVTLENGQVRFAPEANFFGNAQFRYTLSDGQGGLVSGAAQVAVKPVNDAPTVSEASLTINEDQPAVITPDWLLQFAQDIDSPNLTLVSVDQPSHGTVIRQDNGEIRFVPDANFHGDAEFRFTVSDGEFERSATARVTVNPVNDTPDAIDQAFSQDEDRTLLLDAGQLLAGATDVDGDRLSVSAVGDAEHGTVSLSDTGQIRFTPDANYHGPARFSYTVNDGSGADNATRTAWANLTIRSVNDAPVLETQAVFSEDEDTALLIDPASLIATASDMDGDTLTLIGVDQASHGTVTLADGQIRFDPEANFFGNAQFRYTLSDGQGGLVSGAAQVAVNPVNDAPTVSEASLTINEDQPAVITPDWLLQFAQDIDTANLTLVSVDQPSHGTVIRQDNGEIRFVPDANFQGEAEFRYTVTDGEYERSAVARVTVHPVNDAPISQDARLAGTEDVILDILPSALLDLASDIDGDTLYVSAVRAVHGGSAVLDDQGRIRFTPERDFHGEARFEYTVSDAQGGTSTSLAYVDIDSVNDRPVAHNLSFQGREDQTLRIAAGALTGPATDVDGDSLSVVAVSGARYGRISLEGGQAVYRPNANYYGNDSFRFTLSDGQGGSSTATASISISEVNDAPRLRGNYLYGYEDANNYVRATDLATDLDGDRLSVTNVWGASHGSVWRSGDNLYFRGSSDFNGWGSFNFTVRDEHGASVSNRAYIHLNAVNDAPHSYRSTSTEASVFGFSLVGYDPYGANGNWWASYPVEPITSYSQVGNLLYSKWFDELAYGGTRYRLQGYHHSEDNNQPNAPAFVARGNDGYWYGVTNTFRDSSGRPLPVPSGLGGKAHDYQGQTYFTDRDGDRLSYFIARSPTHGHAGVDSAGHWWYDRNDGDGYSGNVTFEVGVRDPHGAVSTSTITTWHHGNSRYAGGGGGGSPVVLDMDNDGIELIGVDDSTVTQDMDRDGIAETLLGWVGKDDALLVFDANQNGQVDGVDEFSFVEYLQGARTDLEGLKAFDSNDDDSLSSEDELWGLFRVWQDADSDGVSDAGEIQSLDEQGITSIDLQSDWNHQVRPDGNVIFGNTEFTRADGSTGQVGDVYFEGRPLETAAEPATEDSHPVNESPEEGEHYAVQLGAPESPSASDDPAEFIASSELDFDAQDREVSALHLRLVSDLGAFSEPDSSAVETAPGGFWESDLQWVEEDEHQVQQQEWVA